MRQNACFLLEQSRCWHYSTVIAENNGNPKVLLNTLKKCCVNPQPLSYVITLVPLI